VGVAREARLKKNEEPNGADVYAPLNSGTFDRVLIARARNDARQLLPMMKGTARSFDERAIPDAHLLADDFALRTGEPRAMSALLSGLALLALSLTCLGVFGIVSYAATL